MKSIHHDMEIRRSECDDAGLFCISCSCSCGGRAEILVRERYWEQTLTDPGTVFATAHFAGAVYAAGYPPCPAVMWSHKYEKEMSSAS